MQTRKKPERQCIGCREIREKKQLIRIVRTPEGQITLDRTGRMNGRGAYLCDNEECLQRARKSGALGRAFKAAIPDEIYDELERQFYDTE